MRFNSFGFTLIELLATISIIAILATVGVVSYVSVLKSSRDHQRKRDLQTMAQALEIYRSDQRYYPKSNRPAGNPLPSPFTSPDGSRTYLNPVPTPPDGGNYIYWALPYDISLSINCDDTSNNYCTGFCLFTNLENPSSSPPPIGNCGLVSYPAGYNYYVHSQ